MDVPGDTLPTATRDRIRKRAALMMDEEPSKGPPQDICNYCGKSTIDNKGALMKCSRCLVGRYCSKACQKQHWKDHKVYCGKYYTAMKAQQEFLGAIQTAVLGPPSSTEEGAANYNSAAETIAKMRSPPIRNETARLVLESMGSELKKKILKMENGDVENGDVENGDVENGNGKNADEKGCGEKDGHEKESLNLENDADGKDYSAA